MEDVFLSLWFRKVFHHPAITWIMAECGLWVVWTKEVPQNTACPSACTVELVEVLEGLELLLPTCLLTSRCSNCLSGNASISSVSIISVPSILFLVYFIAFFFGFYSCYSILQFADCTCSYRACRCTVYVVRFRQPNKTNLSIHQFIRNPGDLLIYALFFFPLIYWIFLLWSI